MNTNNYTSCSECTHNKVCGKLNRPEKIVEALNNFNPCDDNGIYITVCCEDFYRASTHIIKEQSGITLWNDITSDPFLGKGW